MFALEELDLIQKALSFAVDQGLFPVEIAERARRLAESCERLAVSAERDSLFEGPETLVFARETSLGAPPPPGGWAKMMPNSVQHGDVDPRAVLAADPDAWKRGNVFHSPKVSPPAFALNGSPTAPRPWWLENLPEDLSARPRSTSTRWQGDLEIVRNEYRDGTVVEITRRAPLTEG